MTARLAAVFLIAALAATALEGAAHAAPSAEELFKQGQTSYNAGDYARSVATWTESYRLSNEPELLFNIAQALRLEGRCVDALANYRRYVALAPKPEQRSLADRFIRELSTKCDTVKAPGDSTSSEVAQPPSDSRTDEYDESRPGDVQKIVGLAVGGVGVVFFATGLYFGHRASSLGDEVTSACSTSCDWAVYGSKDADGRSAETKQYVFYGLGLVAIAAGGILYWLGSQKQSPAPLVVAPVSDGATISWSGTW